MKIHEVYKSYNPDFFTGTVSIWILFLLQDILHTVRCLQCHSLYPLGASSTHAFNGDKISPGMGSWEGPEWVRSEWTGTVDMGSTLSRTPNLQTHKKRQSSFLCGARLTEVSNSTFRPRCGCWSCVQKTSTMAFSLGSFMASDDFPTETLPDPSVWYSPCFPYLYVTAPPLCSAVYTKHAALLGCWGFSTRDQSSRLCSSVFAFDFISPPFSQVCPWSHAKDVAFSHCHKEDRIKVSLWSRNA